MKEYLECGKIVAPQGLKGEVRVQPWCDSPEYLCQFSRLYLSGGTACLKVEKARTKGNLAILKLEGCNTIDDANNLRGKVLYINREDDPEDGGYFIQDLLGLEAVDADTGASYGKVTDIFSTGANDVYELTGEDGIKRLIPVIPQVVLETQITEGRLLIRPLEGLFDNAD
ncbi:ribosome maturation factor RimM [Oscillospiraceae bacterium MB08-C2-2]|nr:ribosome maturation factor RimM [Oscillospiraceae bacterium MB08-C2-2]